MLSRIMTRLSPTPLERYLIWNEKIRWFMNKKMDWNKSRFLYSSTYNHRIIAFQVNQWTISISSWSGPWHPNTFFTFYKILNDLLFLFRIMNGNLASAIVTCVTLMIPTRLQQQRDHLCLLLKRKERRLYIIELLIQVSWGLAEIQQTLPYTIVNQLEPSN